MIRALLFVRFRAFFSGMVSQARQKNKRGIGMIILFIFLYAYLAVVLLGAMGSLFLSLAQPYHSMGLDWLYFAMSALIALGFSLLGSVFTTQSQLYDAKDNGLLLSMPIPPKYILLTRMIPLLLLNLLFAAIVMLPATVVYCIVVGFTAEAVIGQLLALLAVTLLAQAIACILGWLLHLLLSKLSKSLSSMLYMVSFLVVYFVLYSKAESILTAMTLNSQQYVDALGWIWPLYALGAGSAGSLLHTLGGLLVSALCFAAVYWFLSLTFLRTATAGSVARKRGRLDLSRSKVSSAHNAIVAKELRKFLSTPVYLTNMGLGLIMSIVLCIAGVWFRKDVLEVLGMLPELEAYIPLLICVAAASPATMTCISCPSVSLEGDNIWILKSMPVSSRQILLGKLALHCRLTCSVALISVPVLCVAYGCGMVSTLLCTLVSIFMNLLTGLVGLNAGLRWAKLDYINEAYPCKQSAAVLVTMFGMMGLPLVFGLVYAFWLCHMVSPTVFLLLCAAILGAACFGMFRLLVGWGVKKWESL